MDEEYFVSAPSKPQSAAGGPSPATSRSRRPLPTGVPGWLVTASTVATVLMFLVKIALAFTPLLFLYIVAKMLSGLG